MGKMRTKLWLNIAGKSDIENYSKKFKNFLIKK